MAMRKRLGPIAGTLLSMTLLVAGAGQASVAQATEQPAALLKAVPIQADAQPSAQATALPGAPPSTSPRTPSSPSSSPSPIAFPGPPPHTQPAAQLNTQPTEQQVRKLMDTIGLGRSLRQMNSQIETSMKQSLPCVASNFWQDFVDQNGSREFIGRLVPVYQKHFTGDEVEGMVKFYSSPLGQKVLTEMPAAMAEANQAGEQWSHEHGQQMIAKLEQAGTLNSEGRCPATGSAAGSSNVSPTAIATEADDSGDAATPLALTSHGHSSSHSSRKHTPVKKKVAPKKSSGKKPSVAKKVSKASSKSAPAKGPASKAPVKTEVKHAASAAKSPQAGA